jgi:hypothetical protein
VPVSPYEGLPVGEWRRRTEELLAAHPLDMSEVVRVVQTCWTSIFASRIGTKGFRIGEDIFPKPQIMGFFLHELIPLELAAQHPESWCVDKTGRDKDLVHLPDERFSVEIKTSSHSTQIFGNRSYAQPAPSNKKAKAGYYLTVNFEKFSAGKASPRLMRVAFGWLDHTDWVGQRAATGQQARLLPQVYGTKLISLFSAA